MRARVLLGMVAMVAVGCSSPAAPTPGPTEDPVAVTCAADAIHAKLNVHDVTALDDAIRDCGTMARLVDALAKHPGYLDPAVTTPQEFAGNRCDDPAANLGSTPICVALGRHP